MVIVLLWRWWSVRNKVNASELMPSCQETVASVLHTCQDILCGEGNTHKLKLPPGKQWCPPSEGVLKINIDGAFQSESLNGAWGFVICDHEGACVAAGAGCIGPTHDALMADTFAFKQGLEATVHFGISKVIIETDSLVLKDAVTSTNHDLSVGGGLFQEIRNLIVEDFISLKVCKISRVCNVCAHELAHVGLSWDPGQF
jgi:ribonuclease HI